MNATEVKERLESEPFEPFVIVMSSGDRHEVRRPELAHLVTRGQLYVFRPVNDPEAQVDRPVNISVMHITSIEPAPEHAA